MQKTKYPQHITADKLAEKVGLSTRRVQQLRSENAFVTEETPSGPRYVFVESLLTYIKFLHSKQESTILKNRVHSADARIKEAKAEYEETKLSLLRNEVHSSEHVKILFSDMITQARAAFMDVAGRCAVDCSNATPAEAAAIIDREIQQALTVMAGLDYDPSKFTELLKADGGIIIEADDEDPTETKQQAKIPAKKRRTK